MVDNQALFTFWIRETGFWFLDCSSYDKQEIYKACNEYPASLKNKRVVKLKPDADDETIRKARRFLSNRNTKNFVDLSKGELD